MTSCVQGFNTKYNFNTLQKRTNSPVFCTDVYGDTYKSDNFYREDGNYGTGWDMDWGTFNPDRSCCNCGGDIKFQKNIENSTCVCPEGCANINGKCIPSSANKIIKQTKEVCTNKSPDRIGSFDCNSFADNKICDPEKQNRKGENWTTNMDPTLLENCCSCGGGEKKIVQIPAYSVVDCPEGSIVIDGKCVCPEGSTLVDGECVCSDVSVLVDGKCVCPGVSTLVNGKCVCPDVSSIVDGKCVCPGVYSLVNGKCVCPGVSTLVDGKCVCPGVSTLVDGKCVKVEKSNKYKVLLVGIFLLFLIYIILKTSK